MSRPRSSKKSKAVKGPFLRPVPWRGRAIILLAALLATSPLLVRGPSWSSDLGFHLISWMDAKQSMFAGLVYPRWASSPNFAAGEPRFLFYPPLSWMCGAVMGIFLPWHAVPSVFFLLLLAATGLATRALAREALPDGPATLAGCAAIFIGYVLFSGYKRNDFAELTGGFWIPLLLLFVLRRRSPAGTFWQRTFDGSATPLALVVAGTWLSNGPLAIMAGYLLAAVALVSALVDKSLVPVVRASVSTFGGMGLASIYLVPAICERGWVSIQNAVTPSNYRVENSWLFGHHADPLLASHDMMLRHVSIVAVVMLAVAFSGGAVAWIRGLVPGERRWWLPLALIPPTVMFLLLPVSLPVWNILPELRLLQFPWRWLIVLEPPMAICFALAVWNDRKPLRILLVAACTALFAGISFAAPHWWFDEPGSAISSIEQSWREGIGVPGKPEYAPPGVRYPNLDLLVDSNHDPLPDPLKEYEALSRLQLQTLPVACLLDGLPNASGHSEAASTPAWHGDSTSCNGSGWEEDALISDPTALSASMKSPENRLIGGVAGHAGYLIMRLRYYPAWEVEVNGHRVKAVPERERGLMAVPVPQGNVLVRVDWTTTGDVVVGCWCSAIALLIVAALYLFEQKLVRVR